MQTYVTSEGDSVDYVAWKFYGTQDGKVVEQVLGANPGLSDIGPVLPASMIITLPDITLETAETGVRLWD